MFTDPKNILKKFGFAPGMIVADCGSGIGHFTIPIAQIIAPTGYVYAVDVHRDILTRLTNDAKEHKLTNVHTVWGDIEQPNGTHLKDASVDYVLLANVLHQTKDKPMVLRETLRILKDEGSVLVIDSTTKNLSTDEVKKLCEHFGLLFVSESSIGDSQYGILFSKSI